MLQTSRASGSPKTAPSPTTLVEEQQAPPGISIYFDGITPTAVPKQKVSSSPMRMFLSTPLEVNKDVTVNATHATIPGGAAIQSIYIRNMTVTSSPGWALDYGVANQRWVPNPYSVFPETNFGAAEKLLTLGAEGFRSNDTLDRISEEIKARSWLSERAAQTMSSARNQLVNAVPVVSGLGPAIAEAGLDISQFEKLKKRARTSGSFDPDLLRLAKRLRGMRGSMADGERPVMKSSNNCHHMTGQPIEKGSLVLELGKGVPSFRGQTTFAPFAKFSIVVTMTTVTFNQEENALEWYLEASSVMFLEDLLEGPPAPVYFQGPPYTSADNRKQVSEPNSAVPALMKSLIAMPRNYKLFWATNMCPPWVMAEIRAKLSSSDFASMMKDGVPESSKAWHMKLVEDALHCGLEYMRSPIPSSHFYGLFEASVWLHLLLEVPQDTVADIATWQGWNDKSVLKRYAAK